MDLMDRSEFFLNGKEVVNRVKQLLDSTIEQVSPDNNLVRPISLMLIDF